MKLIKYFLLLFILPVNLHAQTFLIHLGGGFINYGGDLQRSVYTLKEANAFIQGGVGLKITEHYTAYYSLAAGKVGASDRKSIPTSKTYPRNLSFFSNIGETSLTLEYNLNDISGLYNFTPYAFAGLGAFHFNPYTFDTGANKVYLQPLGTEGQGLSQYPDRKPYKLTQFCIPFGFGFKYAISDNLHISAEFGFRKTFTDYLDDVSSFSYADTAILRAERGPQAADLSYRADEIPGSRYKIIAQRGNPGKKDFYYAGLLKITFLFTKSTFVF
jgi:hypothetical protein